MADKYYKSPFKGVSTYEEEDKNIFFGRSDETAELVEKIKNNCLTLIYGKSGIGKSSLLNAGVIPHLNEINVNGKTFSAHRVVLNMSSQESYEQQIISQLQKEFNLVMNNDNEDLNQYFAKAAVDCIPVLLIDQFEEIYYHDEFEKNIEKRNRLLRSLNKLLTENHYNQHINGTFRIVISFREDYLSCVEDDSFLMPQLCNNRYRLLPLTLEKGQTIVQSTLTYDINHPLVEDDADGLSRYIINNLFHNESETWNENDKIDIMYLSLFCRMIDDYRNRSGASFLSKEIVDNAKKEDIISNYYRNSISGLSKACVDFIEDNMLDNGRKKRISAENGSKKIKDGLEYLKGQGILRYYESSGEYEISHDKICLVAQREKDKRQKQLEAWIDYFVLSPLFLFVGFALYFLLNGVLDEFNLTFIKGVKEHVVVHWLGILLMIFLTMFEANLVYLFYQRRIGERYRIYGGLLSLVAIVLGGWHYRHFVPNHNDIFIYWDVSFVNFSWFLIDIGLVSVPPLFTFIFPRFVRGAKDEDSWKNILMMNGFFSSKAVKIYTVILLFVCLYINVMPNYNHVIKYADSIYIGIIGILMLSFFDPDNMKWNWKDKCLGPFLFLAISLGIYDYRSLPGFVNIPLYLLVTFVVYTLWLSVVINNRYLRFTRKLYLQAYFSVLMVTLFTSFFYIGVVPWKIHEITNTGSWNVAKWKYYITRDNGLYGVKLYDGRTLIPCLFDSCNSANASKRFVLCIPDSNLNREKKNTFFMNSHQGNLECFSFLLDKNSKNIIFSPGNMHSAWTCKAIGPEKDIRKQALMSYQDLISALLLRLKYGKSLSSADLYSLSKLRIEQTKHTDSLYKKTITNRINSKYNKQNDSISILFAQYMESVIRESVIISLMDVCQENSLSFLLDLFLPYEMSFFHQPYRYNRIDITINGNTKMDSYFDSKSDTIRIGFSQKFKIDLEGIDNYQLANWQNLWKNVYSKIRCYLQYDWAEQYGKQSKYLPAAIATLFLQSENIIHTLDSDEKYDKITYDNYQEALKLQKCLDDSKMVFKDVVKRMSFKENHKALANLFKRRSYQIRKITEGTPYDNIGKDLVRDMTCLVMLSDFTQSSLTNLENVNKGVSGNSIEQISTEDIERMYKEDSVYLNNAYGDIFHIQRIWINMMNKVIKTHNNNNNK